MTYIDLLQYILNVQNVEKNELARFIGTNSKKLDKILNGEKNLSKKSLKYLSAFTGIPAESIKNGMFGLPEEAVSAQEEAQGENAEADSISEEEKLNENISCTMETVPEQSIKELNLRRFSHFMEVRYKTDRFIMSSLWIISIIVFGLFIKAFVESTGVFIFAPSMHPVIPTVCCLLPIVMVFVTIRPIRKISKEYILSEEKRLKQYQTMIIISQLICGVGGLCCRLLSVSAFLLMLVSCALCVYIAYFRKNHKVRVSDYILSFLSAILVASGSIDIINRFVTPEKTTSKDYLVEAFCFAFYALIIGCGLFWLSYIWKNACIEASKYFGVLPEKRLFRKGKLVKSIISVMLILGIFWGCTCVGTAVGINVLIKTMTKDINPVEIQEYDKKDVVFTDKDKIETVDVGDYTIKIPQGTIREEKEYGITFNDKKLHILCRTEEQKENYYDFSSMMDSFNKDNDKNIDFDNLFQLAEDIIKEEYGFYPVTVFEHAKMEKLIRERGVKPYSLKDMWGHYSLLTTYALISPQSSEKQKITRYYYETDDLQATVMQFHRANEDNKGYAYIVTFDFNDVNDKHTVYQLTVSVKGDTAEAMELCYKIVNSIEIK